MLKILMVCMGNICRSPMARVVAQNMARHQGRQSEFFFDSAGTHAHHTGEQPDQRARNVLLSKGYELDKSRSRKVKVEDFEQFDLVLAMDRNNLLSLEKICPAQHQGKLRLLLDFAAEQDAREVPDPYYGNLAGFERVLELCEAGAKGLLSARTLKP